MRARAPTKPAVTFALWRSCDRSGEFSSARKLACKMLPDVSSDVPEKGLIRRGHASVSSVSPFRDAFHREDRLNVNS